MPMYGIPFWSYFKHASTRLQCAWIRRAQIECASKLLVCCCRRGSDLYWSVDVHRIVNSLLSCCHSLYMGILSNWIPHCYYKCNCGIIYSESIVSFVMCLRFADFPKWLRPWTVRLTSFTLSERIDVAEYAEYCRRRHSKWTSEWLLCSDNGFSGMIEPWIGLGSRDSSAVREVSGTVIRFMINQWYREWQVTRLKLYFIRVFGIITTFTTHMHAWL